jgi:hypothetical protein
VPEWNGKIYAGDSRRGGVSRSQSGEFISASDPSFDQGLWMTYADFRSFYSTYVLGCKEWREGVASVSLSDQFQKYSEVIERMNQQETIKSQRVK